MSNQMKRNSTGSRWHLCAVGQLGSSLDQIRASKLDQQSSRVQEPCALFTPSCAFGSQILNCIWICASLSFPPEPNPSIHSPHWLLQDSEKCQFPPSFSIKHIYISWLGVLSEEYFIFFLIALFAFNFLNFHGLHDVCVGVYLCIHVWVGIFPLHVLVPWTYDPHKLWEGLASACFCSCFCPFEE